MAPALDFFKRARNPVREQLDDNKGDGNHDLQKEPEMKKDFEPPRIGIKSG